MRHGIGYCEEPSGLPEELTGLSEQGGGGSFNENYRRGQLLCCMVGRANPLMDPKLAGVVFLGVVAVVAVITSPTTAGRSAV